MESPTQVTIGAKHTQNNTESISDPTQVTIGATHTQNSTDTDTLKITRRKMVERKVMLTEMMLLHHLKIYAWFV